MAGVWGKCRGRYGGAVAIVVACTAMLALPATTGAHKFHSASAGASFNLGGSHGLGGGFGLARAQADGSSVFETRGALGQDVRGADSHDANPRNGVEEVGFHPLLNAGFNTDVWGHVTRDGRLFGYAGTWGTLEGFADPGESCPSMGDNQSNPSRSGVKIVDLTDPSNPRLAAKLGSPPGAQNNDTKVESVDIPGGFSGDLLTHSLEPCGAEGLAAQILGAPVTDVPKEQTGFQLYDVSDPASPKRLGKWNNGGLGTHNHYLVDRPDLNRVFVSAVWNEIDEDGNVHGVLQNVDVSNPNSPKLASTWELSNAGFVCDARGTDSAHCFLHDVWPSPDNKTLYLSYWDGGLVLLDFSNPDQPRFIGRGQGQVQEGDPEGWLNEEGNTHVTVPYRIGDRTFAIVGDEDFTGGRLSIKARVNSPADVAGDKDAIQWVATLDDAGRFIDGRTADLVYAGTGCTDVNYASVDARNKIALIDDRQGAVPADQCPTYTFKQKVDAAEREGAIGLIQVFRNDQITPNKTAIDPSIPALEIKQSDGRPLRDKVLAGETVNVTIGAPPIDPWGFGRVVEVTSGSDVNWREVSTFKAPHVDDGRQTSEDTFSAHNPIVGPDGRVYWAWYTDGLRVLEPDGTGGAFKEVAWFVPRPGDHPDDLDDDPHGAQEANVGYWGSYPICDPRTGDMLVLNTDLNRGMYILKLTGDSCRLRRTDIPAPVPAITDEGLPRANLVAPRLASDASTSRRFPLRITTAAPNASHFEVQSRNTRKRGWRPVSSRLLASSLRFRGRFGANYRFRARAIDRRGRPGPWDYGRTIVPFDDLRQRQRPIFRGSWWHPRNRRAYVGRLTRSRKRGARMRFRFRGSRVYLVGRKSRRGGKALVILNGKRKRVSFYGRRTRNRRVIFVARGRRGGKLNTLQVINLGRRAKRSRGTLVEVDGVAARVP